MSPRLLLLALISPPKSVGSLLSQWVQSLGISCIIMSSTTTTHLEITLSFLPLLLNFLPEFQLWISIKGTILVGYPISTSNWCSWNRNRISLSLSYRRVRPRCPLHKFWSVIKTGILRPFIPTDSTTFRLVPPVPPLSLLLQKGSRNSKAPNPDSLACHLRTSMG